MTVIIEDTRQKAEKHAQKHETWRDDKDIVIRCKLPYGDYIKAPRVSVDTKQDVKEIAVNMCGNGREKARFREECKLAKEAEATLVFLIEDDRVTDVLSGTFYRIDAHAHVHTLLTAVFDEF